MNCDHAHRVYSIDLSDFFCDRWPNFFRSSQAVRWSDFLAAKLLTTDGWRHQRGCFLIGRRPEVRWWSVFHSQNQLGSEIIFKYSSHSVNAILLLMIQLRGLDGVKERRPLVAAHERHPTIHVAERWSSSFRRRQAHLHHFSVGHFYFIIALLSSIFVST